MISINCPMQQMLERSGRRKRVPCVYIGIGRNFLNRIITLYVCRAPKPNPTEARSRTSDPSAEPATPNNSTTATAGDEAVATDSNTATATDR